jgi:hypothetical protein
MWKMMLPMIQDCLWVGRGLTYDSEKAYAAETLKSDIETRHIYFIEGHIYHNRSLWFLMNMVLEGFLAGLLFMLSGMVHYVRKISSIPDKKWWKNAYAVMYSYFIGNGIFFYTI